MRRPQGRTRALLLACAIGAAAGWLGVRPAEPAPPSAPLFAVDPAPSAPSSTASPEPTTTTRKPPPANACGTLAAKLPLRDRLGQLVMAGLDPADEAAATRVVTVDKVGAVFVGGTATHLLTGGRLAALRAKATVPLLTAVDEEGGRVQRIDALDGPTPSARQLAATMSPEQVTAVAHRRGEQLRSRGVVMDLAPVVDVSDAAANTVIGDRSFSADPATVGTYAGAYSDGLRRAGVIPVLKHFPGHGRGSGDSHLGLVRTPPLAALRADDLRPYATLIPRGEPVVMLGHLDVPGLTGGVPASLSPAAYRLLRENYRFAGVAMTDDLGAMRAVTDSYSLPDAVTTAITAGADIALWSAPAPTGPVLDRLERAVRTGELPQSRVRDAVTHVLRLKTGCV
ncbi:glycoside hydrolase family 3 N-terminal domain-containing protein [Actinophytocola sp. NPDC049390]|uniref:glycoside hydrolase family 3 N-terminal domain-containing protein n=1 Tax=Actinophytocola sp. NPDC049390 TaxID=3363894 RepID=UPI0037B451A9